MKLPTLSFGLIAMALALPACSTGGGGIAGNHPSNTGPFDSRGQYIEDWADNPSKWNRPTSVPVSTPVRPAPIADVPVIAMNDQPPMNSIPISTVTTVTTVRPTAAVAARPTTVSQPKPVVKPKPKPVVKPKPKPKPKPKVVTYTIRKGDTLTRIAARNGTTVAAIQRANRISGSLIHPGKTLVIPK